MGSANPTLCAPVRLNGTVGAIEGRGIGMEYSGRDWAVRGVWDPDFDIEDNADGGAGVENYDG